MIAALPLPVTGALIAGGRGRRLGGLNKAEILLDGERLLDRSIRFLKTLCSEVLLLDGARSLLPREPVRHVADAAPDLGPPGAVLGALEAASFPWIFALGGDMPRPAVPPALALWEGMTGESRAALYLSNERPEPLYAFYAKAAAPDFRRAIGLTGCSFATILRAVPATYLAAPSEAPFLGNVNTTEDLERLGLSANQLISLTE
jgi:molybdopterin-guanine dinucleotide biosynthesis protein A